MKVNIIICPPFLNPGDYIKSFPISPSKKSEENEYGQENFVTTPNEIKKLIENGETEFIENCKSITVLSLDGTVKEREDVITKIRYLFSDIEEKYIYINVSQPKLLYKMFLSGNKNLLPSYLFYDCLEKPEGNVEYIDVETDYDNLEKGGPSVIVDLHCLLLTSSKSRVMLSLPDNEESVHVNEKMLDFLKQASEKGYSIIISHCEDNRYEGKNIYNVIELYDGVFSQISENVAITGFCSSMINGEVSVENRELHKPHPWHLFKIFKDFSIDPQKTIYVGYQTIDKKFSELSGIKTFFNCNSVKKTEKLLSLFSSQ